MTKQLGKDIISKYHTYIRLEKSLSPNSVDAYMRDLEKLVSYAKTENLDITGITYLDLQPYLTMNVPYYYHHQHMQQLNLFQVQLLE